jgi:hypothetical protein
MILNITASTFGGPLRTGDLIAVLNVIQHLRNTQNPNIQFHIPQNAIHNTSYCLLFADYLQENTDFLSKTASHETLPWTKVNLWDFRAISGDLVQIATNSVKEEKLVVFPVLNAPYNTYRNWSIELLNKIIDDCVLQYPHYEKIMCVSENDLQNIKTLNLNNNWKISTDFLKNISHITTSSIFIGGDTGTSHFASVLVNGPEHKTYHYSGRGLLHTIPFYVLEGQGKLKLFWDNFENSTWDNEEALHDNKNNLFTRIKSLIRSQN